MRVVLLLVLFVGALGQSHDNLLKDFRDGAHRMLQHAYSFFDRHRGDAAAFELPLCSSQPAYRLCRMDEPGRTYGDFVVEMPVGLRVVTKTGVHEILEHTQSILAEHLLGDDVDELLGRCATSGRCDSARVQRVRRTFATMREDLELCLREIEDLPIDDPPGEA